MTKNKEKGKRKTEKNKGVQKKGKQRNLETRPEQNR